MSRDAGGNNPDKTFRPALMDIITVGQLCFLENKGKGQIPANKSLNFSV